MKKIIGTIALAVLAVISVSMLIMTLVNTPAEAESLNMNNYTIELKDGIVITSSLTTTCGSGSCG